MKNILLILFFVVSVTCFAEKKIALLIGINTYSAFNNNGARPAPPELNGCVNDVISVAEILKAKFGFAQKDITLLTDKAATRNAILASFEKLLNSDLKAGDVVFMYYSGHGSQVKNSLGGEADGKDETIVPVDVGAGAKDIRDKELARILQKFVDKGIILTFIFDSCHSGSVSRDPRANYTLRYTSPSEEDAKDGAPSPAPENNGALIISSAMDNEPAREIKDEKGNAHGAFTIAFLQTMQNLPANSSTKNIFASIRAIIKSNGLSQEPVLQCNDERKNNSLIGVKIDKSELKVQVAVIKADNNKITLQGGAAIALYPGSILQKINGKDTLILKVESNEGLNRCMASIQNGAYSAIKPGDLFTVKTWMTNLTNLKIYMPEIKINYADFKKEVNEWYDINAQNNLVTNPMDKSAKQTLYYNNSWKLGNSELGGKDVGKNLNQIKLSKNDEHVFVSFPLSTEVGNQLKTLFKTTGIKLVNEPTEAEYYLVGRMNNGKLEYGFINPNFMADSCKYQTPMPIITDFVSAEDVNLLADSLNQQVQKLSKIKDWFNLPSPSDDGGFPFQLCVYNISTSKPIDNYGTVYPGDKIKLMLTANPEMLPYWTGDKRYVYVFLLDSKGKMQLYYASTNESVSKFPKMKDVFTPLDSFYFNPRRTIVVNEDYGMDSYFLLTTNEPIQSPEEVFNQDGVVTRTAHRGDVNAITKLIKNTGVTTRSGDFEESPDNWSVHRIMIKCKPKTE